MAASKKEKGSPSLGKMVTSAMQGKGDLRNLIRESIMEVIKLFIEKINQMEGRLDNTEKDTTESKNMVKVWKRLPAKMILWLRL